MIMRYGRRATVFSTTAISWVCVLCSAVVGAWVFDLIPHRIPLQDQQVKHTAEPEAPLVFDQLLQESQSEPQPLEAAGEPHVAASLSDLFGEPTASTPMQTSSVDDVAQLAFEQTLQPLATAPLTLDQTAPAHLMSPETATAAPAQLAAPQDPFAAFEAKQRKYEFVPAEPVSLVSTRAPQDDFGWQRQGEPSPSMTMKSEPFSAQNSAHLVRTASNGGDGYLSPAAPANVSQFQPANPHSGQFQPASTEFSQLPIDPSQVDAYTSHPGQSPNVMTRTLSYNPERDHVQLLADPYRGDATLEPAHTESSSGIQQTGFSSSATQKNAFENSMGAASTRFSNITGDSPRDLPTQSELMDRVLDGARTAAPSIDEQTIRKSPQDEVQRLRTLSELYWSTPQSRPDVQKEIDDLSRKIYFSPSTHYMTPCTVAPGEMLQNISKTYNVPWQYLARLNRVTPEKVRAGSQLKVIKGPFSAIVDVSDHQLIIHAHGYYVCRFPVGCGKNDTTPKGTFVVKNKETNPTYYGPEGVIDADDPANPLGERWIDLGDSIGIHGTIEPESIGQSLSKGCVRMHADHVAIVYDLLGIGSEVTIVD